MSACWISVAGSTCSTARQMAARSTSFCPHSWCRCSVLVRGAADSVAVLCWAAAPRLKLCELLREVAALAAPPAGLLLRALALQLRLPGAGLPLVHPRGVCLPLPTKQASTRSTCAFTRRRLGPTSSTACRWAGSTHGLRCTMESQHTCSTVCLCLACPGAGGHAVCVCGAARRPPGRGWRVSGGPAVLHREGAAGPGALQVGPLG